MRVLRARGAELAARHDQQGQGGAAARARARGPGAHDVRLAQSPQPRNLKRGQKAFPGKSFSQRDSTQRANVGKPESWTVRAGIRAEVIGRGRISRARGGDRRAWGGEWNLGI